MSCQGRQWLVGGTAVASPATASGKREQAVRGYLAAFRMMFDHQLGPPLGLHRKPSRVETAKRFLRVSLALNDRSKLCVRAAVALCVRKKVERCAFFISLA